MKSRMNWISTTITISSRSNMNSFHKIFPSGAEVRVNLDLEVSLQITYKEARQVAQFLDLLRRRGIATHYRCLGLGLTFNYKNEEVKEAEEVLQVFYNLEYELQRVPFQHQKALQEFTEGLRSQGFID